MSVKRLLLLEDSTADQAIRQGTLDANAPAYDRSYHWMRTIVGILGALLPPILVCGWKALDDTDGPVQGSLSAYYHTGMRDFFVGILVIVGILLFTYMIAEKSPENYWSQFAGAAAIVVALVPTGIPGSLTPTATRTPLQTHIDSISMPWKFPWWSEKPTSEVLHYGSAFLFILSLFFLCLGFARGEWEKRKRHDDKREAQFPLEAWFAFHVVMALFIAVGAIWTLTGGGLDEVYWLLGDEHRILVGETVATVAFGLSWLLKGWHGEVLFGKKSTSAPDAAERSSTDTGQGRTVGRSSDVNPAGSTLPPSTSQQPN